MRTKVWLVDQSSSNLYCRTGGIVVDNAVFWLLISRSVPDIFALALQVQSCPKSRTPLILCGSESDN